MSKEGNKKIGRFVVQLNKILGKGSFGCTCSAYLESDRNEIYACKIINKSEVLSKNFNEQYFIRRLKEEFAALKVLKHPHIVTFYDFEETKNNLYMFFEHCEQDLEQYIKDHIFAKPNHEEINRFTIQIIEACSYFSEMGFLHRDIKPANILILHGNVKLADFGLAKFIPNENEEQTYTYTGTPHYMAPEIISGTFRLKDVKKCDVWSVGVTLYELSTGILPFKFKKTDLSDYCLLKLIENCPKGQFELQQFPLISKLIEGMLVQDPAKRISFIEAANIVEQYKLKKNKEI